MSCILTMFPISVDPRAKRNIVSLHFTLVRSLAEMNWRRSSGVGDATINGASSNGRKAWGNIMRCWERLFLWKLWPSLYRSKGVSIRNLNTSRWITVHKVEWPETEPRPKLRLRVNRPKRTEMFQGTSKSNDTWFSARQGLRLNYRWSRSSSITGQIETV